MTKQGVLTKMKWFYKKNETPNFYYMLKEQCDYSLLAIKALNSYILDLNPITADEIEAIEKKADSKRRTLLSYVESSFITPLDRHDISSISRCLDDITDKIKGKLGEVLLSQLLPYIGNMNEFKIEKKYILKVIENICNKYNYMSPSSLKSVYGLICESDEELEKVKKEMNDDKTLENFTLNNTIIKNANKHRIEEDDDEDDDE